MQNTVRWRSNQSQPAIFWNPWSNNSEWWPPEGDNPWNLFISSRINIFFPPKSLHGYIVPPWACSSCVPKAARRRRKYPVDRVAVARNHRSKWCAQSSAAWRCAARTAFTSFRPQIVAKMQPPSNREDLNRVILRLFSFLISNLSTGIPRFLQFRFPRFSI